MRLRFKEHNRDLISQLVSRNAAANQFPKRHKTHSVVEQSEKTAHALKSGAVPPGFLLGTGIGLPRPASMEAPLDIGWTCAVW